MDEAGRLRSCDVRSCGGPAARGPIRARARAASYPLHARRVDRAEADPAQVAELWEDEEVGPSVDHRVGDPLRQERGVAAGVQPRATGLGAQQRGPRPATTRRAAASANHAGLGEMTWTPMTGSGRPARGPATRARPPTRRHRPRSRRRPPRARRRPRWRSCGPARPPPGRVVISSWRPVTRSKVAAPYGMGRSSIRGLPTSATICSISGRWSNIASRAGRRAIRHGSIRAAMTIIRSARQAGGQTGADHRAHRGAHDPARDESALGQRLGHAEVRVSPRTAPAQRQGEPRRQGHHLQIGLERVAGIRITALQPDLEPLLSLGRRAVGPGLGIHLALGLGLDAIIAHRLGGVECLCHLFGGQRHQVAGLDRVARPTPRRSSRPGARSGPPGSRRRSRRRRPAGRRAGSGRGGRTRARSRTPRRTGRPRPRTASGGRRRSRGRCRPLASTGQ